MPGGYQLMVTRAKVTAGDDVLATRSTVTVRDGVATYTTDDGETVTADVEKVDRSRRAATVTLADGTVLQVARAGCGCGGR